MGTQEVEFGLGRRFKSKSVDMNEIGEFFLKVYEISAVYKEKKKKYHYQKIEKCEFVPRD